MSSSTPLSKEELRAARLRNLGILQSPNATPSLTTASTISNATSDSIRTTESAPLMTTINELAPSASRRDLSMEQFSDLCDVLYRNSGFVTADDMDRWCNEGFRFCEKPNFGLMQGHGGPCGVLAVVQAEIFRDLFYDENYQPLSTDFNVFPETIDKSRALLALCRALFRILKRSMEEGVGHLQLVTLKDGISELAIRHFGTWEASSLQVTTVESEERFLSMLMDDNQVFGRQLSSGAGCLLFLMSTILTRGIHHVKSDMSSDPSSSFIGQFGHCNQETVNLLLAGRATSLVLDGSQTLDTTLSLSGIPCRTDIGYLSALEAARYVTVGSFLKRPHVPIWVLGGTTHFTVLCSRDPACNSETSAERLLETMRRAFKAEDEHGAGFVSSQSLRHLLERVAAELDTPWPGILTQLLQRQKASSAAGSSEEDSVELARLRGLCQVDGEIILWQGFWTQCSQLLTGKATLDDLTQLQHSQNPTNNHHDNAVDLSMFTDDDQFANNNTHENTRLRSDSELARMLQAEFDEQGHQNASTGRHDTQQASNRNNNSVGTNVNTNINNNVNNAGNSVMGGLDFSSLLGFGGNTATNSQSGGHAGRGSGGNHSNNNLQLYMFTGATQDTPNHPNETSRPRSDSEVARDLQAQFDMEMDVEPVTHHGATSLRDTSADQMLSSNPLNQTSTAPDANNATLGEALRHMDSVADDTDEQYTLWHFNGLQGGVLRQVQLFRRRLGDTCVGQVVSLETADALALSDGRSFEDLLRTRWPGCSLKWDGPEPRLE